MLRSVIHILATDVVIKMIMKKIWNKMLHTMRPKAFPVCEASVKYFILELGSQSLWPLKEQSLDNQPSKADVRTYFCPSFLPQFVFLFLSSPLLWNAKFCYRSLIYDTILFRFLFIMLKPIRTEIERKTPKGSNDRDFARLILHVRSSVKFFFIWFVRLLALRLLLAYCVSLGW
jgi:hypothetical protein